ncbi:pirin family protein [Marinoscillum pacificum]|uniref:pirin family protein n=1 Tax=Marinoscillum pacificum TaxID=392723 RepID=UPI0021573F1B|nr:pirin family protein [Marinoscillum pacificum]
MSNSDLIIEERSRDIGDFMVGRLIPFRKKRMVGPFIFIDHMGPSKIGPGSYLDVDVHPHIGLSTLTFLLDGEIVHQDSLGTNKKIVPGSVNWMVAGKGVTHTERTPESMRDGQTYGLHGYQIWVALPKELEFMEPEFHHLDKSELPSWTDGTAEFVLVAGKGFGKESPLPVHSELFMVEIKTTEDYTLEINSQLEGEIGICIVEGSIQACEHSLDAGNMLVSKTDNACNLTMKAGTHIFLFGGKPFPEERYISWNWVATEKETLAQAKQDWIDKKYPKVPGDDSYVPFPGKS